MIEQILPNNNERCYSNFSPTFREVNTPFVEKFLFFYQIFFENTLSSIDEIAHEIEAKKTACTCETDRCTKRTVKMHREYNHYNNQINEMKLFIL
jgi:hypothetical protein